ncbi:MAG: hypothetical protein EOP56_05890 [Sphingobacteriales bacterium]|nr:MAG: hypothetical protein EOP56_05890 [Sphingobacteriales bacterium]
MKEIIQGIESKLTGIEGLGAKLQWKFRDPDDAKFYSCAYKLKHSVSLSLGREMVRLRNYLNTLNCELEYQVQPIENLKYTDEVKLEVISNDMAEQNAA